MQTPPMSVIRIAMTIATIGRLTKNSDMIDQGFWGLVEGSGVGDCAGGGVHSFTVTDDPSRTFCQPWTITLSPGFSPSVTSHNAPIRSPIFRGRMCALLSA